MKAKVLMFPGGGKQPVPPVAAAVDHTRRDALVLAHLDMVPPIARNIAKCLPPSFDVEDLVQNGTLGLIEAAERFDATIWDPHYPQSVPFSAYARPRVAGAIMDSVRRRNYREATHDAIEDHAYLADTSLMEYDREADIDHQREMNRVYDAIEQLPDRDQTVLRMYYREEETLGVVGHTLRVHSSRASQLHLRAIARLRIDLAPETQQIAA